MIENPGTQTVLLEVAQKGVRRKAPLSPLSSSEISTSQADSTRSCVGSVHSAAAPDTLYTGQGRPRTPSAVTSYSPLQRVSQASGPELCLSTEELAAQDAPSSERSIETV